MKNLGSENYAIKQAIHIAVQLDVFEKNLQIILVQVDQFLGNGICNFNFNSISKLQYN